MASVLRSIWPYWRQGVARFRLLTARHLSTAAISLMFSSLALAVSGTSSYFSFFRVERDIRVMVVGVDWTQENVDAIPAYQMAFSVIASNPGNKSAVIEEIRAVWLNRLDSGSESSELPLLLQPGEAKKIVVRSGFNPRFLHSQTQTSYIADPNYRSVGVRFSSRVRDEYGDLEATLGPELYQIHLTSEQPTGTSQNTTAWRVLGNRNKDPALPHALITCQTPADCR